MYISLLVCIHLLGIVHGNFIINRKVGESDEIILLDKNKDPFDVLAGGTFKDNRTCIDDSNKKKIRRNIAALSSSSHSKKISCYSERELKTGRNMATVNGVQGGQTGSITRFPSIQI